MFKLNFCPCHHHHQPEAPLKTPYEELESDPSSEKYFRMLKMGVQVTIHCLMYIKVDKAQINVLFSPVLLLLLTFFEY
jgi:hypothetical protein